MNKKDYIKYNTEAKDKLGKDLHIGDIVVVNNYYKNNLLVEELTHYTFSRKCAIKVSYMTNNKVYNYYCYRDPCSVIKIRSGESKDEIQSNKIPS